MRLSSAIACELDLDVCHLDVEQALPGRTPREAQGSLRPGRLQFVDGVCFLGLSRVQPLCDHGEQRHTFPARSILRRPPADAGIAVLQAGVPSRPAAKQNGPPSAPVFFPEFWIQPRERLLQNYGHRDRKGRALARRYMAPAAGTDNFPGPDSWIGRAQVIIRC